MIAMGPRQPRSTSLTEAEEAIVVEFRCRTLLPLDDVLGCLRETIPALSRSALHRCLARHGISRLPRDEEKTPNRKRFAETAIGHVHIDVRELRLAEGKGLGGWRSRPRLRRLPHPGLGRRCPPGDPPRRTGAPVACPPWIYVNRRLVENLRARLKEWRSVATRHEKTARSSLGVLCIAASSDWLKP